MLSPHSLNCANDGRRVVASRIVSCLAVAAGSHDVVISAVAMHLAIVQRRVKTTACPVRLVAPIATRHRPSRIFVVRGITRQLLAAVESGRHLHYTV